VRSSVLCLVMLLTACGGGGGGRSNHPPPPSGIGAAGGTVQGPNGSQAVIPAGALSQATAIAVAVSSAGAPQLPAGMRAASDVFAFTPHGTTFATPATVTLPFDPSRVQTGFTPRVYKTNAAQSAWELTPGASVGTNTVSVQVSSFSWLVVGLVPPQITQQPQDIAVDAGGVAAFSVVAESTAHFEYQWQRSNDNGASFTNIAGAVGGGYELVTAAIDNGAQFRVIVSGAEGSTTSNAAILTVAANSGAPTITSQPQDRLVILGANATFSVTASGGGLGYQWERADPGSATFNAIAGETNAEYTLANAQNTDHNARFRVRVANPAGSVLSRAALLSVGALIPSTRRRIDEGVGTSVARLANGELRTWGSDDFATLGNGPGAVNRLLPGPVEGISDAVDISVGSRQVLALLANGAVRGWGGNFFGGLGYPRSSVPVETPRAIPGIPTATAVCAGVSSSLFLLPNGTVLTTGEQPLGDGGNLSDTRFEPVAVAGLENVSISAIACSSGSFAVLADRTLRAWGSSQPWVLGLGNGPQLTLNAAQVVPGLDNVIAISPSPSHTLVLRGDGSVWAWGQSNVGQLGTGSTQSDLGVPVATLANSGFTAVSAGFNFSMALRADGTVFVWGSNALGELATGAVLNPVFTATPRVVNGLCADVVEIAAEDNHPMAVCADGTVWSWGFNENGQVGNGQHGAPVTVPTQVGQLDLD
jgi:alpha-tubulin suppressor-like RCC1 family protein